MLQLALSLLVWLYWFESAPENSGPGEIMIHTSKKKNFFDSQMIQKSITFFSYTSLTRVTGVIKCPNFFPIYLYLYFISNFKINNFSNSSNSLLYSITFFLKTWPKI